MLCVVENPRFGVEIVILSVVVDQIYKYFRFGGPHTIFGCRSLSQSSGVSFYVLGVVESPIFAVVTVIQSVGEPEI